MIRQLRLGHRSHWGQTRLSIFLLVAEKYNCLPFFCRQTHPLIVYLFAFRHRYFSFRTTGFIETEKFWFTKFSATIASDYFGIYWCISANWRSSSAWFLNSVFLIETSISSWWLFGLLNFVNRSSRARCKIDISRSLVILGSDLVVWPSICIHCEMIRSLLSNAEVCQIAILDPNPGSSGFHNVCSRRCRFNKCTRSKEFE